MWAIFARYRRILGRLAIEDDAGFAVWASTILRDDPPPGLDRPRRVVVFEPPPERPVLAAIEGLDRGAEVLWIALTQVEGSSDEVLHDETAPMRDRLREMGFPASAVEDVDRRPDGLTHLARSLFHDVETPSDRIDGLHLVGSPGGPGQSVAVARRVLDLIDSGARPDDVLVILPRLDADARLVAETLTAWGIASIADVPARLAAEPAISALRRALKLPIEWEADELVRLLRNGRIRPDWPESRPPLALATAATAIRESRVYWGKDAILQAVRRDARPSDGDREDERSLSRIRRSTRATSALPLIERLLARLNAVAQPGSWTRHAEETFRLAEDLGLVDDPAIDALRLAIDDQGAILDRLGRGRVEIPWASFVREIERSIREAEMPAGRDGGSVVRVISAADAKGASARHVLLAGMGEGTYPARSELEGDDESAGRAYAREMSRFRRLIDVASNSLTLIYPTTDEKGQDLLTAGFLDDVARAFAPEAIAGATSTRDRLDPILPPELAIDPAEARVRAVDLACNRDDFSALQALASQSSHRDMLDGTARALQIAHWRGRRARFGRFDGRLSDVAILDRLARDFAPDRRTYSPSQLEDLALCPFRFYQKVVLKLRPVEDRRELEDDHPARGTILHRALENLHALLRDMPPEDGASLADRVDRGIEATFEVVLEGERIPSSEVERGLRAIEVERLRRSARRYARQFRSYADGPGKDSVSKYLEIGFGGDADGPPPLAIGPPDGGIRISGVIDRIDVMQADGAGYFRVIDYKTGAVPESKGVDKGLDLQLPLYALAAHRVLFAGQAFAPLDAGYWGLKAKGFRASRSMTSVDGDAGDLEAVWSEFTDRFEAYVIALVDRLLSGDFPVHPRKIDCERFCDYRFICRIGQTRRGAKALGRIAEPGGRVVSQSPVPLTPEQDASLRVRDASVALSAGAGCGKTRVLTERFLAFLDGEDRHPLARIVALTFTDKAARELRDRIRRSCRDRIARGEEPGHWRTILRGLETARIGTFHAFCARILRQYAVLAAVDPEFEILDDAVAPSIREEAVDSCLRRWLAEGDADLFALSVEVGLPVVREALGECLAKRPDIDLDHWSSRDPAEMVASWERFRDGTFAAAMIARLIEEARPNLALLATADLPPKMIASRDFLLGEFPRLGEAKDLRQALADLSERATVKPAARKTWCSDELFEGVKGGFEMLRARIKTIREMLEPDAGRSLLAAEMGIRFARLASGAIAAYAASKAEAAVLDYDDLQSRVRVLIRDAPEVREELASTIDVLLVDEFQDTDGVQSEILEHLAGAGLSSGRMFLVGDPKQSIYRFRGARPAIFGAFRERIPASGRLGLTENFRSVPGILAFVNALFADTFPGEDQALRPGPEHDASGRPAVDFFWAGGSSKDASSRRSAEAASLARMLDHRLRSGWPVRDRDSGRVQDAVPGDVALLFRSRSDFPIYEQALACEGLDYHVVGGSTYFAQQEVIDLLNLLAALDDPLDPLALAGTLRGPIFGVSDEGLYWLATRPDLDLPTSFLDWTGVADSLSDDDRSAVGRASRLISRWGAAKDRVPIATLLDTALRESGFEAALTGEFLGTRKRANVRKLVQLARKFDARGSFTLSDFVERLRADVKSPPREDQASTTDERGLAIRLMTIHQAKGLEFPIVVLPDLDRAPNHRSDLVAYHPDLGPLVRVPKDDGDADPAWSLGRTLHQAIESHEEREESLRIFYVATTRARDCLILSAGTTAEDSPRSPAMSLLDSRFDRGDGSCRATLPDHWPSPCVAVKRPDDFARAGPLRKAARRPKLLLAASRIARTPVKPEEDIAGGGSIAPGAIDLDDPAVSACSDVLTRLFRHLLIDPEACGPTDAASFVDRVARARGTWITSRTRGLAISRLIAWRATSTCRAVANSTEVRRAVAWTSLDPSSGRIVSSRFDFAYRDAGGWSLVNVVVESDEPAKERERDRLRVGILAAERSASRPSPPRGSLTSGATRSWKGFPALRPLNGGSHPRPIPSSPSTGSRPPSCGPSIGLRGRPRRRSCNAGARPCRCSSAGSP